MARADWRTARALDPRARAGIVPPFRRVRGRVRKSWAAFARARVSCVLEGRWARLEVIDSKVHDCPSRARVVLDQLPNPFVYLKRLV